MSLFRKPTKKIQRRVFGAAQDDDEDGDPEPPPPPIISKQKKENKPAKPKTLLSFADEEEDDGEVFKVKKSSQSKRLIKKREKEKKYAGDSKYENNIPEDKPQQEANNTQQAPRKKKVTLEGLILSGREALAADGAGDMSDDEPVQEEEEEEATGGFHRYRAEAVRAVLAAGVEGIPDAALIHAARKTRQQARELGGDYIPVRPDSDRSGPGSRLVRDDGSGDDEEGIMHVRGLELPSDKPKRGTAAAPTDAELHSAGEEWEEQQMNKGIDLTGESRADLNPFTLAPAPPPPPPPRLDDGPPHLRPLLPAPDTPAQLADALRDRVAELRVSRDTVQARAAELASRLLSARRVRDSRAARAAPLDAAYKRAQAARAYLTDLLECADEKMPELEALESRALALHKRRCEFVQERRRADVRDETQDVLALAARAGAVRQPDPPDKVRRAAERAGRRRARRTQRAQAHTHAHRDGDSSDDELEPGLHTHLATEREEIRQQSASLFADALPAWRCVRGVCARMSRWRRREPRLYKDAYVADCLPRLVAPYVRHQLILWNPLADEDNEDYERMDWYKCLMMYGVRSERLSSDSSDLSDSSESSEPADVGAGGEGAAGAEGARLTEAAVREDADLMLVPTVMRCVVLPKLTELVQHAWDPMSVRACVRLRGLLVRCAALPPRGSAALRRLAAAAAARLAHAARHDVLLPALPLQIMEGGGGVFWRRCLGAGVRLLRAALALCAPPDTLHAEARALRLIGTLCCAAAAAPPAAAAHAAAALASTLPPQARAAAGPGDGGGGELRARALRLVGRLAEAAAAGLDQHNPQHLKALEQTRSVLAQARACE